MKEMEFWCSFCERWIEETRAWGEHPAFCKKCSELHGFPWVLGFVPVRPKPKQCGWVMRSAWFSSVGNCVVQDEDPTVFQGFFACVLPENHEGPHSPFKAVGE